MRSLTQYLLEEFDEFKVNDLEVKFRCNSDKEFVRFHIPEVFSEDDLLLYLQDKYLKDLPASEDRAEEFFGDNAEHIYDVYFEYSKYQKDADDEGDCVEWDTDINKDHNSEDEDFTYARLYGLKYVIKFDEFNLLDQDSNDIMGVLYTIFSRCNSDYVSNKWPIKITLTDKWNNIKYRN